MTTFSLLPVWLMIFMTFSMWISIASNTLIFTKHLEDFFGRSHFPPHHSDGKHNIWSHQIIAAQIGTQGFPPRQSLSWRLELHWDGAMATSRWDGSLLTPCMSVWVILSSSCCSPQQPMIILLSSLWLITLAYYDWEASLLFLPLSPAAAAAPQPIYIQNMSLYLYSFIPCVTKKRPILCLRFFPFL